MSNHSVISKTYKTSFIFFLRIIIQATFLLVLARTLGPTEFGIFAAIAASAVILGTLSNFGTNFVLIHEEANFDSNTNRARYYAWPTTIFFGINLLVAHYLIAQLITNATESQKIVIFLIGASEIIILPLINLVASLYVAKGRAIKSQAILGLPILLKAITVCGISIIPTNDPLTFFSYAYFFTSLAVLLSLKLIFPSTIPSLSRWLLPRKDELKNSVKFAISAFSNIGPSEIDKVVAVKLLSTNTAGLYIVASRIIGASITPVLALTVSILPYIFKRNEKPQNNSEPNTWISHAFIYGFFISGILIITAPFLEIAFGNKFHGVASNLILLVPAIPALGTRILISNMLMATGKPLIRSGIELTGMFSISLLSFMLTAKFEINGIIYAVIISEWLMLITAFYIYKNYSIKVFFKKIKIRR